MSLPDMRNWSEKARRDALKSLEERDKLFGFDSEESSHYDEEDYSRDFSASYADASKLLVE